MSISSRTRSIPHHPTAVVYCEANFGAMDGKTANGLVRHSEKYKILSVIDSTKAGQDSGSVLDEKENPTVGLLNVGAEVIKGNSQVKEANDLLKNSKLNYVGFVEGDDIFCGNIDVIVCDGFVGNIALKTSEGIAKFISSTLKEEFKKNVFTKIAGISSIKVLNSFKKIVDPRRYNGASLLGLKGIIIKSHGGADSFAFNNSLNIALKEVKKDVPKYIDKKLKDILG